ncbi:MAG: lactate utilization protein [Geminicoccaceae bacterium]
MSGARETILAAVRAGLGGRSEGSAAIAAEAAALLAEPDLIRPALVDPDPVAAFAAKAATLSVGTSVERVTSFAELPLAVRRYLERLGLPARIALQPTPKLLALDWTGIAVHAHAAADEPVGVGLARWGIAESGSLVFHSGPDNPVLLSFLPLHHIVTVEASTILPHLEDYAALAAPAPRNANMITGASGTTDIEGSYVSGAHGPGYLHIVVVGR